MLDIWQAFWHWWAQLWPWLLTATWLVAALLATHHILLTRQDPRGALGWLGVVWLFPLFGVLLYPVFGINRITRRARRMREGESETTRSYAALAGPDCGPQNDAWRNQRRLMDRITHMPLQTHNRIELLAGGSQAYPAMLQAIAEAKSRIDLATFILASDATGQAFIRALEQAVDRGVEVRLLVDGAGQYYTFPSTGFRLRRSRVPHALFLHSLLPWRMPYINLRNHRKILIVDNAIGFTGGMNISARFAGMSPQFHDLHFRIRGPVLAQMAQVFEEDWSFANRQEHPSQSDRIPVDKRGTALARGIADGPDENFDRCRWTLIGAIAAASAQITIVTPYFLPDEELVVALNHAAMRGVDVNIILPGDNNWPIVQWAANNVLPRLLKQGCRIWMTRGCFDHSKFMIVDDIWSLIGSANLDPRSLRLNFEFNLEVFDQVLTAQLTRHAQNLRDNAQNISTTDLRNRPYWQKLRDGLARLFSPYL